MKIVGVHSDDSIHYKSFFSSKIENRKPVSATYGSATVKTVEPEENIWEASSSGVRRKIVPKRLKAGDKIYVESPQGTDKAWLRDRRRVTYRVIHRTDERLVLVAASSKGERGELISRFCECLQERVSSETTDGEKRVSVEANRDGQGLLECILSSLSEETLVTELMRRKAFPFQ